MINLTKLLIATLVTFSFSDIPVFKNESVMTFISDVSNEKLINHKSGKNNQRIANKISERMRKNMNAGTEMKNALLKWNQGDLDVYDVNIDSTIQSNVAQKFLSKMNGKITRFDKDGVVEIQDENFSDTLDFLNKIKNNVKNNVEFNFLDNLGPYKEAAEKLLVDFDDAIEFDTYEIEYLDGKQVDLNLRYRRIFESGIVLGHNSYIYIEFKNKEFDIKKIQFRWPTFVKNEKKTVEKRKLGKSKINVIATALDQNLSKIPGLTGDGRLKLPKKANVQGAALAWKVSEDQKTLEPHYSFIADVEYDDNIHIQPILNYSVFNEESKKW